LESASGVKRIQLWNSGHYTVAGRLRVN
jgi:hypothetical protein